ncbi:deoxyribose-phosphate aldolase [Pelosinus sp. IPA-1]|uniref:deoxyribose-phosphate aldolase n=1 Tax=Pelosinus sp. IPA-1 TaxID=3029569 RepID=UPI00243616CA|nr:deoxyribose-phosphate aldolase [Pelosinus sp. IPA-1]GMB01970.1 deoxyribose-phosphate aldolase [Pelosinus sp. IPA-1]
MDIAQIIDHTMLKPEATQETIRRYCAEARTYGFATVCVNSCHAALVASELKGTGIKTCCVVGFPLGAMLTGVKAFEAEAAVKAGAEEVDMVINIGGIKDGNMDLVTDDIRVVVEAAKPALVKVIIETCLLSDEEKIAACKAAVRAGAAYVKTSTGFSTGGATVDDVKLMRQTVGNQAKVKASGSIRTREFACQLVEAGADRIGAGNGVVLLK